MHRTNQTMKEDLKVRHLEKNVQRAPRLGTGFSREKRKPEGNQWDLYLTAIKWLPAYRFKPHGNHLNTMKPFSDRQNLGKSSWVLQGEDTWYQLEICRCSKEWGKIQRISWWADVKGQWLSVLIKLIFHGIAIYTKISIQQTFDEYLQQCLSRFLYKQRLLLYRLDLTRAHTAEASISKLFLPPQYSLIKICNSFQQYEVQ